MVGPNGVGVRVKWQLELNVALFKGRLYMGVEVPYDERCATN